VHGIRYFVDGENAFHKFAWFVIMGCSCSFLAYLIVDAWILWESDSSLNTIDRVELSELDFPAVTICPDWPSDSLAIQTVYNMMDPKTLSQKTLDFIKDVTFFKEAFYDEPPRWMGDESMNSLVNLELRKTDLDSYLFAHEGNLWNNLIFKVDELYMESCEGTGSNSAFCDFTAMVLARKEETEEQEWFEHWKKMNAKMEWQFDPMMEEAFERPIYPDYFAFIDQTIQKRITTLWFGEDEEEKGKRRKRQAADDEGSSDQEFEYKDKSKLSFTTEMLDFVSSGDLGKAFRESEAYMDWKWEQEELGWPQDQENDAGDEEEEVNRDERDLNEDDQEDGLEGDGNNGNEEDDEQESEDENKDEVEKQEEQEGNQEEQEGNQEELEGNQEEQEGNQEEQEGNQEEQTGNQEKQEGKQEEQEGKQEEQEENHEEQEGNLEEQDENQEDQEGNQEKQEGNQEEQEGNQ